MTDLASESELVEKLYQLDARDLLDGVRPAARGAGEGPRPQPRRVHRLDGRRRHQGVTAHGTSDELGFKAAEHPAYCYDLHATALHLLGIDHEKLSVYNNGIKRRLTDVHGHVIEPIIA